jgi:hypothetical protein
MRSATRYTHITSGRHEAPAVEPASSDWPGARTHRFERSATMNRPSNWERRFGARERLSGPIDRVAVRRL